MHGLNCKAAEDYAKKLAKKKDSGFNTALNALKKRARADSLAYMCLEVLKGAVRADDLFGEIYAQQDHLTLVCYNKVAALKCIHKDVSLTVASESSGLTSAAPMADFYIRAGEGQMFALKYVCANGDDSSMVNVAFELNRKCNAKNTAAIDAVKYIVNRDLLANRFPRFYSLAQSASKELKLG